ncbi:MAG TPA: hypothetical protein VK191_08835 [Symbiobacteriaceae bacterium]|nr:hypothetical protein [Symbiobacteriaceae bacterium]
MRRLHAAIRIAAAPGRVQDLVAEGWSPHLPWMRVTDLEVNVQSTDGSAVWQSVPEPGSRLAVSVVLRAPLPFLEPLLEPFVPDWLLGELWALKQVAEQTPVE